ncbi:MAG: flagellar basal-body MS-ring/collar protein FliF [Clostridiaceae bacterium]|nr:flagellar M-ring protein FliF [Eubacteriales bacterium]
MADFLKNTFKKIAERFKSLTKGQKTRLIVLVTLVAAIIVAASVFLNQKSYDVLYSGMDAADAGEVLAVLTEKGVDAKTQGTDTILVESSKADSIRMQLAAEGYPKSGYNYDIFAMASGLGTTDMEQRVYLQFQLQEDLRQAILTFSEVKDAVVNLSLSEDNTFVLSSNDIPATASIVVTLKDGAVLTNAKARTIAEVCTSIRGLYVENIRIMDSNMNLYDLTGEDDDLSAVTDQLTLQKAVRDGLKEQVINLLAPIFGEKGVLAEVSVVLDFDEQTEESVVFNPPVEGSEDGLAVSMQELAETVRGDAAEGEVSGIEINGGGTSTYPSVQVDENTLYGKVTREANYELNEIRTQIKKAKGSITGLSVSVILDSSTIEEDYTDNVRNLVATAIGVDISRITVERLPFLRADAGMDITAAYDAQQKILEAANQAQLTRSLITAGTVIVVFLLLLAAIRTLTRPKKAIREIEAPLAGEIGGEQTVYAEYDNGGEGEYGADEFAAVHPGAAMSFSVGEEGELPPEDERQAESPAAKLRGRAARKTAKEKAAEGGKPAAGKAAADETAEEEALHLPIPEIELKQNANLKQLENFIDKSPEAVALLLRTWLSDER